MPFSNFRDSYDAETLMILQAVFDEAWAVLMASGTTFDQEAARTALADKHHDVCARGRDRSEDVEAACLSRAAPDH